MSTASTRIPQPKDWQEFERQIEILAQCWLSDPNAKGNGRVGQRQHGVDVFGRRDKKQAVGFQCKEKFEKAVTEKELLTEVGKAVGFRPKLDEFILVTTAPRDAVIQKVARELTASRNGFSVEVWGWEDIEQIAAQHPAALRAFDPTFNPLIAEEIRGQREQNAAEAALILSEFRALKASVENGMAVVVGVSTESDTSTELHGKITFIQDMIDEGDLLTAIPLLDRLVSSGVTGASPSESYRIKIAQANIAIKREQFDDAGILLVDAAKTHPEHKNAPTNLAMGYMLSGRGGDAETAALTGLASDPTNQKMADTLAQARALQDADDPFEGIDPSLQNSGIMWGLKSTIARIRNDPDWKRISRDGLVIHPDDKFLKRFAAEATVDDCILEAPSFVIGEAAEKTSYEQVQAAADELFDQVSILRSLGGEVHPALAHNAAVACRLVDRFPQAIEILKAAVQEHPGEASLAEQAAMDLVLHGDPAEAVPLLENLPVSDRRNLTLAAANIEIGEFDLAQAFLEGLTFPSDEIGTSFQFLGVHLEWYRRQKRLNDARRFFAALTKKHKTSPLPHLFLAKVERLAGNDIEHGAAVAKAVSCIDDTSPFAVVHELADEAFRAQQFEVAVSLLKDRVALDHENEPLSLCIAAAMNGDLHKTASDLLDRVPAEVADQRWYRRVRAALANKIGSKTALPILNSYIKDYPEDVEMRTARIGLWQTQGQTGKVRKDVEETDFNALRGTPFSLMQFFRVATAYSDGSRSVRCAYNLLLENWDNVDCHTGYHGLFLSNERIKGVDLAPREIGLQCAFRIVTKKKGDRWIRIEDTRPAVFGDEWIAPTDDLAKAFFGKSVKDVVSIEGAHGKMTSEVQEIKSVYLDAFHRSLGYFNERFPNSGAMLQMSVDKEADDPFVEMKQIARRMSERNEQVLNLYRDNPIPIVWLAELLGKDEIECAIGIPAETGIPFRVCQGTAEERETAFSVIANNGKRGVIVDAVTAVLIKRLNIAKAVEAVCGPIKTTSTTIERLTERVHEAEGLMGRSMGSFGYKDGQYFLTESSQEHQEAALAVRMAELEWARDHLEIAPALPRADLNKDARQMADMVGLRAIAPAIAANGADLPLLADDFGIRIWAKAALNVDGIWLQPILMNAKSEGFLSEDDYASAIESLLDAGFSYVSVDTKTLLFILKKNGFKISSVTKALQVLLGKPADLNRNLLIALSAVMATDQEKCPRMTKLRFLSQIATAACYPRWEQAPQIIAGIVALMPDKDGTITHHLAEWYRWNSMGG